MLIPDRMGVMILGEASLFPQAMMPLFIFEPRYRSMLAESLQTHRMFCMAMQRMDAVRESPTRIATLGLVRASVQNPNGTSNLVLQGLIRVRLGKIVQTRPFRKHLITPIKDTPERSPEIEALLGRSLDLVEARLRQDQPVPLDLIRQLAGGGQRLPETRVEDCIRALRAIREPGRYADLVAALLLPNPMARQMILEAVDPEYRLRQLVVFLLAEVNRAAKGDGDDESLGADGGIGEDE
jgi:Lon protease-like protein